LFHFPIAFGFNASKSNRIFAEFPVYLINRFHLIMLPLEPLIIEQHPMFSDLKEARTNGVERPADSVVSSSFKTCGLMAKAGKLKIISIERI
jgi:hypothetical protein